MAESEFVFDPVGDGPLGDILKKRMQKNGYGVKEAVRDYKVSQSTLKTYKSELLSLLKFLFERASLDFNSNKRQTKIKRKNLRLLYF